MYNGERKRISDAVVKRLPKYYKCLVNLAQENVERTSSQELSRLLGFTASQIRQDFSNFGEFGQQGYGYNVEQLSKAIAKILGLNTVHKMIIIGAGNLGQALANYVNFDVHGFKTMAIFDVNPKLIGLKIREVPILDIDKMKDFIDENDIEIAVITVPQDRAAEVAQILSETNISGIWNFAPTELNVPDHIIVENVHLTESLFTLSYRINEVKISKMNTF